MKIDAKVCFQGDHLGAIFEVRQGWNLAEMYLPQSLWPSKVGKVKNLGIMSCILIRYTYDESLELIQLWVQEHFVFFPRWPPGGHIWSRRSGWKVDGAHEGIFAFTLWTNPISWESCQVAIHNWNFQWSQVSILYQNIEALYIYVIGTFFMWNQISACFIFTWTEKLYPFLCAIYLYLVSCLMEPTGTGQSVPP
jgi:hypothetical protein